jgi:hypothetical protein
MLNSSRKHSVKRANGKLRQPERMTQTRVSADGTLFLHADRVNRTSSGGDDGIFRRALELCAIFLRSPCYINKFFNIFLKVLCILVC